MAASDSSSPGCWRRCRCWGRFRSTPICRRFRRWKATLPATEVQMQLTLTVYFIGFAIVSPVSRRDQRFDRAQTGDHRHHCRARDGFGGLRCRSRSNRCWCSVPCRAASRGRLCGGTAVVRDLFAGRRSAAATVTHPDAFRAGAHRGADSWRLAGGATGVAGNLLVSRWLRPAADRGRRSDWSNAPGRAPAAAGGEAAGRDLLANVFNREFQLLAAIPASISSDFSPTSPGARPF